MLRERRGGVHHPLPGRLGEADAPRMEVELVLDAVWEFGAAGIFGIAQDGVADDGHVGAKLVLPAGDGLERDEGDVLPGPVHHGVMRHRRLRHILLAWARFPYAVAL